MPLGTPARRMPIPEDVRDFLGDLLGKPVSVTKANKVDFSKEPDKFVTGLYVDDKDRLIGACITDISLAATTGAALAMMPAAVAKEAVEAGKLEEGLRDNFYEVVNIMSRLLNGPSVPHLRLTDLVDGVPQDVLDLVEKAKGRKHYDVTVVGYAGGGMGLVGA